MIKIGIVLIKVSWFVVPVIARVAAWVGGCNQAFKVEASLTPSSDAQFDALQNGTVDAVVTAMDNVMAWNKRDVNLDACIIGQVETTTPLTLVGCSGIGGLQGLLGRRLLVDAPKNGFVIALQNVLLNAGVSLSDCSWVEGGGVAERFNGLREGVADATLLGPPFDSMALAQGFEAVCCLNELYPEFPGQGLVVRREVIEQKGDELNAWLLGLEQSRRWVVDNLDEAQVFLKREGLPPLVVKELLKIVPGSLLPSHAGVDLLIEQRQRLYPGETDGFSYSALVDVRPLKSIIWNI